MPLQHVKSNRHPRSFSLGCVSLFAVTILNAVGISAADAAQQTKKSVTPAPTVAKLESLPRQGLPAGYEDVVAITNQQLTSNERLQGSLLREIVRQAMLIAAMDELDLATLDPSLGEAFPKVEKPQSFACSVRMNVLEEQRERGKLPIPTVLIELSRPTAKGAGTSWQSPKFVLPPDSRIESLAEQMGIQSRKPFAEGLRKVGYKKSSKKPAKAADEPQVDDRLDIVAQFALVRQLHSQIRDKGETSESVGALVRAYANLASLTDFHWSPASKSFAARSLVYAERLIAESGKTPFALAHQAYALALIGRHAAALETVQAAKSAKGAAAPAWLDLIEAYCAYKPDSFLNVDEPLKELAAYLRMRLVFADEADLRNLDAMPKFLALNPACGRAIEMLGDEAFPSIQEAAINVAFPQMWKELYSRLAKTPDLPESAKPLIDKAAAVPREKQTDEYQLRVQLIDRLRKPDPKRAPVPAWAILAGLLQEESFVQAWRTLNAEANVLGRNTQKSLGEFKPLLLENHPFRAALDGFAGMELAGPGISTVMVEMDPAFREVPTLALAKLAMKYKVPSDRYLTFGASVKLNADSIYNDADRIFTLMPLYSGFLTRHSTSPHWPASIVEKITFDWEFAKTRSDDWERTHATSPLVVKALVKKYKALKRTDDAVRLLKASVAASETQWALIQLALAYKEQGNEAESLATLERSLKAPNASLQPAQINHELARNSMWQGEWQKALPHAEAAAASYTAFGLLVASQCHEGLKNYEKSEHYIKELARNRDCEADWYFWCVRTEHGDRQAARKYADQYWTGRPLVAPYYFSLATGQLIDGERAKARETLTAALNGVRDPSAGLYAAVLADGDGDSKVRDELLVQTERLWMDDNPYPEMAVAFRAVVSGAKWNTEWFDKLVAVTKPDWIPTVYYAAGLFVRNRGQKELGDEYLQSAATAFQTYPTGCLLATIDLRSRKVAIGPQRRTEVSDKIAPLCSQMEKAAVDVQNERYDPALAIMNEQLKRFPKSLFALLRRAELHEKRHDYAAAVADYKSALQIDRTGRDANLGLAWLLSTCERDDIRDGAAALKYAETAAAQRTFLDSNLLSITAAAHAELGAFDKAIQLESQAQRQFGFKIGPHRLRAYNAKKPFRHVP